MRGLFSYNEAKKRVYNWENIKFPWKLYICFTFTTRYNIKKMTSTLLISMTFWDKIS